MSIFNELLSKVLDISNKTEINFNDELKAAFETLDKFVEDYQNGHKTGREKDKNLMTTLQSINEDDDDSTKPPEASKTATDKGGSSAESGYGGQRLSKKRSKEEVVSPEAEKRQKRKCHVKAQNNITKQVNTNLIQKLRREDSNDKSSRSRKENDKGSAQVVPPISIKQEKISIPPEPMEMEPPQNSTIAEIKREVGADHLAMPPPTAPVPKPRKAVQNEKSDDSEEESGSGRRRTNRSKKTEAMPPPPAASSRSTRSSRRGTKLSEADAAKPDPEPPALHARPKRTRNKKQTSETVSVDSEKENLQPPQENGIGSPTDKPRPKRTRRGQKNTETEPEKPQEPEPEPQIAKISPKEERISHPEPKSPLLQKEPKQLKNKDKNLTKQNSDEQKFDKKAKDNRNETQKQDCVETQQCSVVLENNLVSSNKINVTVTLSDMDKTMVLPNGVYNHAPVTQIAVSSTANKMNETIVLESNSRETIVLDRLPHAIMDSTVVLERDPRVANFNSSILTDDNSDLEPHTPPKEIPQHQPVSAVKEKVQQFEEMAARTTRTKTRAMAKMDDPDNQTPPDKIIKPVLSAETLNKMNNLIFNGKQPQVSSSASKLRAPAVRPTHSASTSKLSALGRQREAADDALSQREDARKKKEALLEAKREQQKKKREEKMAAAAAAREAAERERRVAMEAAAKERMEKQAHADQGKLERLREVERKKQELARKVAETEERRRAEEQARQQRLAEEQRRADAARRKQAEEAEAMKKEEAIMAKEIEKRQKAYIEKQKLKHRHESHTPLKGPGYYAMEPTYMADGFQYLVPDEEEDQVQRPVPVWSTSKARRQLLAFQLDVQQSLIDTLFPLRVYSPDLREIFPDIERGRLKRTSSAVWRTPPTLKPLPALLE